MLPLPGLRHRVREELGAPRRSRKLRTATSPPIGATRNVAASGSPRNRRSNRSLVPASRKQPFPIPFNGLPLVAGVVLAGGLRWRLLEFFTSHSGRIMPARRQTVVSRREVSAWAESSWSGSHHCDTAPPIWLISPSDFQRGKERVDFGVSADCVPIGQSRARSWRKHLVWDEILAAG